MAAPLFFLSYARADDDGYVKRFYDDFIAEVQRQSGQRRDDVGFRDLSSVQAGSLWRDELIEALSTTSTFVALCSPTYYTSEYCGKEWWAYRSRLERHRSERGIYPPTLLPVIWVPGAHPPDAVRDVQYEDDELGGLYAREGLHFLLRLVRYRDEYNEVLIRLARRVVALDEELDEAFKGSAPTGLVDLDAVPSAFVHTPPAKPRAKPSTGPVGTGELPTTAVGSAASGSTARAGTASEFGAATVRGGPRHVNFVVAAATSAEMVRYRRDLQHYGPDSYDWAPYRPELQQRICVFAQNVASGQNLTSGLARTDEMEALLDQAEEANEIVVLLVDAWATKVESFRRSLSTYDRRNEPTSPVLVPWSSSDQESAERYDELRTDLHQTFPRNLARGDTLIRDEIANSATFQIELEGALVEAQSRVFRFGRVVRRAGGAIQTERPILTIPERGTTP